MKAIFAVSMLTLCLACTPDPAHQETDGTTGIPFYVGTYTNGDSQGIYRYLLEPDGSLSEVGLAAAASNPSFLSLDQSKEVLVAVNEEEDSTGMGGVTSYAVEGDSLHEVSRKSSGGAYPCFVNVTTSGHVLVANYGDGTVALLKLSPDGALSGPLDVQQHVGSGTTDRQKSPHAHSVWTVGSQLEMISVDLGTNELWFSSINPAVDSLQLQTHKKLNMAPDIGPRHLVVHPNGKWIYVLNELSSTVAIVERNEQAEYHRKSSVSMLPADFDSQSSGADIHLSPDGRFLYASNRGHNSIVIYEVNPDDGSLQLVGHELTQGEAPRNFALSPDGRYLLVANQGTNTIVSFERNEQKGTLAYVGQIAAPTPVCIIF